MGCASGAVGHRVSRGMVLGRRGGAVKAGDHASALPPARWVGREQQVDPRGAKPPCLLTTASPLLHRPPFEAGQRSAAPPQHASSLPQRLAQHPPSHLVSRMCSAAAPALMPAAHACRYVCSCCDLDATPCLSSSPTAPRPTPVLGPVDDRVEHTPPSSVPAAGRGLGTPLLLGWAGRPAPCFRLSPVPC